MKRFCLLILLMGGCRDASTSQPASTGLEAATTEAPKLAAAAEAPPARPAAPKSESAKEAAIREELAKLQGSWQMVAGDRDGTKIREGNIKKTKAEIKDDKLTLLFGGWTLADQVKFDIDPTVEPKQMTETVSSGWNKGKQNRGIYKLEGDRLTICTAKTGKDRPTEFASKPGSEISLRVFEKIAEKKKAAEPERSN